MSCILDLTCFCNCSSLPVPVASCPRSPPAVAAHIQFLFRHRIQVAACSVVSNSSASNSSVSCSTAVTQMAYAVCSALAQLAVLFHASPGTDMVYGLGVSGGAWRGHARRRSSWVTPTRHESDGRLDGIYAGRGCRPCMPVTVSVMIRILRF